MKWSVIADSSCDLHDSDIACKELGFSTIPFTIRLGGHEFVDDESLDATRLLDTLEATPEAGSTACPSPHAWAERFRQAENSIAITISKSLSGSYDSAITAKRIVEQESPEKRIVVLDSRSTGPGLALCVQGLARHIKEGLDFDAVVTKGRELLEGTRTVFGLASVQNLVKNGRLSRLAGFVAEKLRICGVGIASLEGKIEMKTKVKGTKKLVGAIIDDMRDRGMARKEIVISHVQNLAAATALRDRILELWGDARVTILPTRGLDSFYAEREGLIVSYS